jgi:translation initiation factor IF-3
MVDVKTKEVKFRPTTEVHDLTYKVKNIRAFLDEGHRVKVVVQMRGREQAHPEVAEKTLNKVIGLIPGDFGVGPIRFEGRFVHTTLRGKL